METGARRVGRALQRMRGMVSELYLGDKGDSAGLMAELVGWDIAGT